MSVHQPYPVPSLIPNANALSVSLNRKLSQRSLALLNTADTQLVNASQDLSAHPEYHIAAAYDHFQKTSSKVSEIITANDHDALSKERFYRPTFKKTADSTVRAYYFDDSQYKDFHAKAKETGNDALINKVNQARHHIKISESITRLIQNHILPSWAGIWRQKSASYNPAQNGMYPFRDMKNNPLSISILPGTQSTRLNYSSELVKPFINQDLNHTERAALYDGLACRPFKEPDVKGDYERSLIGHNTVVATRFIPKGTCLGVYGGRIIPDSKFGEFYNWDDTYMMRGGPEDSKIDGDNILSRINTVFKRDEHGKPIQAPDSAYNVEWDNFKVKLSDGSDAELPAIFAKQDIKKDEELRLNYNYRSEIIARLLGLHVKPRTTNTHNNPEEKPLPPIIYPVE